MITIINVDAMMYILFMTTPSVSFLKSLLMLYNTDYWVPIHKIPTDVVQHLLLCSHHSYSCCTTPTGGFL